MPSNPAVVTTSNQLTPNGLTPKNENSPNNNRPPILDVLSPTLHLRLVRRSEDTHIRPKHDPLADRDEAAVQDGEVEIGVEPAPDGYVAAVVDPEGGLDEGVVSHVP